MEPSWLSLLPFLIVIILTLWWKEIFPGLVIGLLVGAFLAEGSFGRGFNRAVQYVLQTLSNRNNMEIISFLYGFGGLVGLMQVTGGIRGAVEWLGGKIRSEKGLFGMIWLSLPFTFLTPMFRIMMIAPVLKALHTRWPISKKRLGYIMDVSTEPVIVLLPAATAFVGFMISIVDASVKQSAGTPLMSPYRIFLYSLPLNFFAVLLIGIGLFTTFFQADKNVKCEAETRKPTDEKTEEKQLEKGKEPPRLSNALSPLTLLLAFMIYFFTRGGQEAEGVRTASFFATVDASFVMMVSVIVTLVFSFFLLTIRGHSTKVMIDHFFKGGNQLMPAILLLVLVWSVSLAAEDLGFSRFISERLAGIVPSFLVPLLIFVSGSFISYFIGTSWGTWGLLMPLGVGLAIATGSPLPLTVGAVFASGTFGAFASPLGDTTITTAAILEMPIVEYAKYKLKVALLGAGLAAGLYFIFALLWGV